MQDSFRVLHVSPYFEDAWAFGAIPRVVSRLARGLSRRGHRVQVFTTDARGPDERLQPQPGTDKNRPWSIPRNEDPDGLSITVFPNLLGGLAHSYQVFTPRGLSRTVAEVAPDLDLAHLHACYNLPVTEAARSLRRAGIPYILQPNGTGPRIESRRWARFIFDNTLGRGLLEGAAGLLAVSPAERRQLESLGVPDEKIHLLPNPLDLGELDPKPRRGEIQRRWPGEGRVLVYLGQLTPRKGLTTLIRALTATPDDLRLAIFGADRGMAKPLQRLARKLGIETRVAFLGCIEGKLRFSVLAELREVRPEIEILVVDDGSADDSVEWLERMRIRHLRLAFSLGVGGAIRTGLRYALEHGFSHALRLDADGQHPPREIAKVLEPILDGKSDAACGSRFLEDTPEHAPFFRRIAQRGLGESLSILTGQ